MTTPVKPETEPNPPSPNPNPDPPPTPTEPAGGAADPFAGMSQEQKDRMLSFYMGAAGQQEQKIRELTTRLEKVETPKPPTPDAAAQAKTFYDKPVESVTEIVRREINEAIEPLKGFVRAYSTNDELSRMKNELRGNPTIAKVLDVGEVYVDRLVSEATSKGAPLTREMVMGAVASVKGGIDLGWITGGAPAAQAAPAAPASSGNPQPPAPPHLRPSAPPAPVPGAPKKLRELSEEERRLARENKMSDEDYLLALDMPAGAVTNPDAWKVSKK